MIKKCSLMFCISACVIGVQVLSAMGLGKVFGLPDGAALLPFGAFFGAHGIPQVIAGIYDTLGYWNYDEASAFGTTYATIGMLYGIIAGIIILNIGIRKGWVSAEKSGNLSDEDYTGILKKEHRVKFMKSYTSDIAFDPLTMHFAIVMAIMIVAYGLLEVLHKIPLFSGFAIYVPAIIVSLVAGIILRKTRLGDFLDSESLAHIGSLALDRLSGIGIPDRHSYCDHETRCHHEQRRGDPHDLPRRSCPYDHCPHDAPPPLAQRALA